MDSDGNHAPDGILGPYREKEGSFYIIQSIWSPIQIEITENQTDFDGSIKVSNGYLFSDLSKAHLEIELIQIQNWEGEKTISSENIQLGSIQPGATEEVKYIVPMNWSDADY